MNLKVIKLYEIFLKASSPEKGVFALYQITVVYGGRHLVRVFPSATGYVVLSIWLHFD